MAEVTHPEMVRALVKSGATIHSELTPQKADLWHAATGIAGEGAELLEGITLSQYSHLTSEVDIVGLRENLLEESGDLYFYVEQLVQNTLLKLDWVTIRFTAKIAGISPDNRQHYAASIAVECGHVLDLVKKHVVYNKELDLDALDARLIKLLIALGALGLMFGITHEEALDANIAKLSKRYEGLKYSDTAAQVRADKMEETNTVSIPVDEYQRLLESSDILAALEAGGVDNWEWYDESLKSLREKGAS